MELKKQVTYKIPFRSKSVMWCGIFLGISIFLRCFYRFLPCDFTNINAGKWIFRIILPVLLCGAYGILIRIVKLRSPGLYGILSAAICFTMFIGDLFDNNLLQIIFSVITMPLLSLLLLATFGGYVSKHSISGCALLLVCLLRFLFWIFSGETWLETLADLSALFGLFFFTVSLKAYENG